jgi:hypothetical protein
VVRGDGAVLPVGGEDVVAGMHAGAGDGSVGVDGDVNAGAGAGAGAETSGPLGPATAPTPVLSPPEIPFSDSDSSGSGSEEEEEEGGKGSRDVGAGGDSMQEHALPADGTCEVAL